MHPGAFAWCARAEFARPWCGAAWIFTGSLPHREMTNLDESALYRLAVLMAWISLIWKRRRA
jgi:hypothetical protein